MTFYEFIFSNKKLHRLSRHLVFWVVYAIYFWAQSINPMNYNEFFVLLPYKYAFINFYCFIPLCILSVYLFIYILLPAFLKKRRYALFSLTFFSWFAFAILLNYFFAGIFLNSIHYSNYIEPDFIHKLNFSYSNTVWAITIALLSVAIKLSKNWYLQQKENLAMAERKARTELRMQKAFIQPDFLFRSLDSISSKVDISSEDSATMILKLSDLLSYSLYQDDLEMVSLEKELACLKDLISIEQRNFHHSFYIDMQVNGDASNKYIPPLIILAQLQEIVTMLSHEDVKSHQVNCLINIQTNHIAINISFLSLKEALAGTQDWSTIIRNTRNRLNLFYSQAEYLINVTEGKGEIDIGLNMPLPGSPSKQKNELDIQPNSIFYEPA